MPVSYPYHDAMLTYRNQALRMILLLMCLSTGLLSAQTTHSYAQQAEDALLYLELDNAEAILKEWEQQDRQPPQTGAYLFTQGGLALQQMNTEEAIDILARSQTRFERENDTIGLIKVRLRRSQAFRFDYQPGQALVEARSALRLLPAHPHRALLYAQTHRELAAAYMMMGYTLVNSPDVLMPQQAITDSVRHHLQQAEAFTAAADTLGQLITSNLWVEYHSNRRGELALALPYLQRSDSLAQSYGARFPYPVIRVQELWAGYYQRIYKQPANNRAGIAAAQKALALRQQVFGPEHPGHAIPLYTLAALRFLYIDYHSKQRSVAAYDSILQTLLTATQMTSPGFQPKHLYEVPAPEQIKARRSFSRIMGLRIQAFFMRSNYSQDSTDWVRVKDLGLAFRRWIGGQLNQAQNYYQLDSFVAAHQVPISISILALNNLFKANPKQQYWEEALRLTQLYRSVELRRQWLQRALLAGDTGAVLASAPSREWTIPELRAEVLEADQGLLVNHRLPGYITYSLALTPDSCYFSFWGERGGGLDSLVKSLYLEIGRAPDSLRERMPRDTFLRAAHELYRRTWALLGDSVLPYRVLVVPDPNLIALPMGMLPRVRPEAGEPVDYLGLHHAFSYAYSLETLALQRRRPPRFNGRWMGVAPAFARQGPPGDPCQNVRRSEGSFDSLCYVEPEVQDIALWVGLQQTLLGGQATKAAVLDILSDYDYLHFATHAEANPQTPGGAYLATSNLYGEDFRLTFDDIITLDLPVEQVVLSGCRTSQGTPMRGEGMLSLDRAFAMAGARSVVSSLWSVDDEATRQLMPFYYQALAEGHPKDVAMHRAILAYREVGHSHPAFWMAFRIHGDVSPVRYATWWSRWGWVLALGIGLMLLGWWWWRKSKVLGEEVFTF